MEILDCPIYKDCKEECLYFEEDDCTYYIDKEPKYYKLMRYLHVPISLK